MDLNKKFKPTLKAKNHLLSGKLRSSNILDKVVKPQRVSISQADLKTLISLSKTTSNFPLSKEGKYQENLKIILLRCFAVKIKFNLITR